MKNLLGYLTCVAVAILLRVYINGSGGTLVLYLLAIAFVISLAALLITKRKLVAAIKLSTEISAKNEEFDADIMLLNAIRIIPSCVVEVTAECTDNIGAVEQGVGYGFTPVDPDIGTAHEPGRLFKHFRVAHNDGAAAVI